MIRTAVSFSCDDYMTAQLFTHAEQQLKNNIQRFAGHRVLVEGGGYNKLWLETQPMGGEMYAKRDLEIALNNTLLFMDLQRDDGRLPGSIMQTENQLIPQFDKIQGFCFPDPALNLYYWAKLDSTYLNRLADCLCRFDQYLWAVRDSDHDGCLESWCQYDTGEDNALRYQDAPYAWASEIAPTGYQVVPMASMDFMSYSFSCRQTTAKIHRILGHDDKAAIWQNQALAVRQALIQHFWIENQAACFDLNPMHKHIKTLTHNNLRAMYWGIFTPQMARAFISRHLLNPAEFWTTLPLPSVAANDPVFRNISSNNWSGQVESLTHQRAIQAMENYHQYDLIPKLGKKYLKAVWSDGACHFVQQFDPFTAKASDIQTHAGYGPALLTVLEYLSRLYGVTVQGSSLIWSAINDTRSEYTQQWDGHEYKLKCSRKKTEAFIDRDKIYEAGPGLRVETDVQGRIKAVYRLLPDAEPATVWQTSVS